MLSTGCFLSLGNTDMMQHLKSPGSSDIIAELIHQNLNFVRKKAQICKIVNKEDCDYDFPMI